MGFAGEERASCRAEKFLVAARFEVNGEVADGDAVDDADGGYVDCGARVDDDESSQAAPELLA